MLTIKKYILVIVLASFMIGCNSEPVILQDYNDFTNSKTCKLERFDIKYEPGFTKNRLTSLGFQKFDEKNIVASITTVVPDSMAGYPVITNGTKIIFNIIYNNQNEQMIFKAEKQQTAHMRHSLPTQYGTTYYHNYESTVFFTVTIEQLTRIANAEKVEFNFEVKETPIQGILKNAALKYCLDFINVCYKN